MPKLEYKLLDHPKYIIICVMFFTKNRYPIDIALVAVFYTLKSIPEWKSSEGNKAILLTLRRSGESITFGTKFIITDHTNINDILNHYLPIYSDLLNRAYPVITVDEF